MQGRNRCAYAEFGAHQAHATDAARGRPEQGHDRINAQQAAATPSHHHASEHQRHGDHHRRAPELAQFPQG